MTTKESKKTSWKVKLVGYGFIFSLFLVLIVVSIEFYFRIYEDYGRSVIQHDSVLGWRMQRGFSSRNNYAMGHTPDHRTYQLNLNKQGFRGKDFELKKEKGVVRILLVADSYGAALSYPDDTIFPQALENRLNEDGDQRYEVLNASSPAWGIDQQYLYWKTEGNAYQPDYVLWVASPNDIREGYCKKVIELTAEGAIQVNGFHFPRKDRFYWWLANKSSFYQYLQQERLLTHYGDFYNIFAYYKVNYGIADSTDWDLPIFLKEPFEEVQHSYRLFEKLFTEIHDDCKNKKIKMGVAIIPTKSELSGNYDAEGYQRGKVANYLDSLMQRLQIPYCNPYPLLADDPNPTRLHMSWEYHFNEEGHRFMAETLYRFFKDVMEKN